MPKGKNKGGRRQQKRDDRGAGPGAGVAEDEEGSSDAMSVTSAASDAMSIVVEGFGEEEVDETSAQENFEDKLKDLIDGLTEKSAKGRTECLKNLAVSLRKKYIYDFLIDRKVTVIDGLERCLKKGGGEEQAMAAMCVGLVLIQLGSSVDSEELFKEIRPLLLTVMADKSRSSKARAACAETLAIGSFIASEELDEVTSVMKCLENVFKASYLKGDGSTPNHTPDIAALHNSSLSAWTLLLSIAPPSTVDSFIDSHLTKLPELLNSADVDLRVTAGECIALMYELAREGDEDFEGDDIAELCETLKQLATDSNKFRAKKDRRHQRANFRDILRAVEEGDPPYYKVRFAIECLHIDTWTRKRQYDAFCHTLGLGMNVHLQENEIIRDIFGLGAPQPISAVSLSKTTKAERHLMNAAAFKARTKARAKHRDKRSVAVNGV